MGLERAVHDDLGAGIGGAQVELVDRRRDDLQAAARDWCRAAPANGRCRGP